MTSSNRTADVVKFIIMKIVVIRTAFSLDFNVIESAMSVKTVPNADIEQLKLKISKHFDKNHLQWQHCQESEQKLVVSTLLSCSQMNFILILDLKRLLQLIKIYLCG